MGIISWFQSPCAGNMFGKIREAHSKGDTSLVSIPVCGEHVW
jgi:hypothetical protein